MGYVILIKGVVEKDPYKDPYIEKRRGNIKILVFFWYNVFMKTVKNTSSLTNYTLVNDTIQLRLNFNTEIYIQSERLLFPGYHLQNILDNILHLDKL